MKSSKSHKERIVLDRFRACYPEFPKGKIVQTESPDFILKISPRISIGIELTALPSVTYEINRQNVDIFLKDLMTVILKKEAKLKVYRKKRADAYWLLIYADSIEVNGISPEVMISEGLASCGFERIVLLDFFRGRIWGFPLSRESTENK